MAAVSQGELRPGLCVFLDPAVLVGCPGCRANVRSRANLVNRPGPFLVVAPAAEDAWLCVPLISRPGSGRLALRQDLKSGPGNGWRHRPSYYSVHQFWVLPAGCIAQASGAELSPLGARQCYAAGNPDALAEIARHRTDSDARYRLLVELPDRFPEF